MDFQQTIFRLKSYWAERGCIIQEPYDVEVGAGTMCPETFGPKPYRVAHVQPSRRGFDGRHCENRNRLCKCQQLQMILKPLPALVSQRGCILQEPYDIETFLRVLGPPYRVACVKPSRRASDGRYRENPNLLYGCAIQEAHDVEAGAGTMCPETCGLKPYRVAHVQPSRRGTDGHPKRRSKLVRQVL